MKQKTFANVFFYTNLVIIHKKFLALKTFYTNKAKNKITWKKCLINTLS